MSTKPVAFDLFAGAGGLSSGFVSAGFDVLVWVEKNPHACQTLRVNHDLANDETERVINDPIEFVCKADFDRWLGSRGLKKPDLIVGGPPCQGYSRSNKQSRTADNPLNSLYQYFLRVVRWYKPRLVIMENVNDLRHFERGEVLDDIRSELASLGYLTECETLDAANYGVPQHRHRAIVVGHRPRMQFEYPSSSGAPPNVWDAISDLPELENGNLIDRLPYSSKAGNAFQRRLRNGSKAVTNNLVTRNGELVLKRYKHIPVGGNWRNIPDELMQNYADKERCHNWIYRRLEPDKPSVTITNFRKNMLIHPVVDRGLSVREAARLQSFPDDYVFTGGILHQQQQVADAVPPLMAEALGRQALRALNLV